jgi:ArsR family transcriptional regulator
MYVNMFFVTERQTCAPDCCPELFAAPLDEAAAGDLADILKALADPTRLRLISLIASAPNAEACACDLSDPVGRSQPTVSHHLSQLVAAGLLEREQRGKWAWFRLNDDRVAAIAASLTPTTASA